MCLFPFPVEVEAVTDGAGAGQSHLLQAPVALHPTVGQPRAGLPETLAGVFVDGSGDVPAGSLKKAP